MSSLAYNMIGITLAVIVFLLVSYLPQVVRRRAFLRQQQIAREAYAAGLYRKQETYRHHSGRLYVLLFVTNVEGNDVHKWPITACYCTHDRKKYYSRPLHEFMINMAVCDEVIEL